MKIEQLTRTIMLAAGFIAVLVILCSQSLFTATGSGSTKTKTTTEQSADKQPTFVQAPSDAIPGHTVQVDDSSAFQLITSIFESEEEPELPHVPTKQVSQFFEVLFRTLIAPNAP